MTDIEADVTTHEPTTNNRVADTNKELLDENSLIKTNEIHETITIIHSFLFDILTFFSNFQPNLIIEYCQEEQNVCKALPNLLGRR